MEKVLNKGIFPSQNLEVEFVEAKSYIIMREGGESYLYLQLHNQRGEELTEISLRLTQIDSRGRVLSSVIVNLLASIPPRDTKVLNDRLPLYNITTEFMLEILSTRYNNVVYKLGSDGRLVSAVATTPNNNLIYTDSLSIMNLKASTGRVGDKSIKLGKKEARRAGEERSSRARGGKSGERNRYYSTRDERRIQRKSEREKQDKIKITRVSSNYDKKFRVSIVASILAFALLILSSVLIVSLIITYRAENYMFTVDGVRYKFIDGNYAHDVPVVVMGADEGIKEIVIRENVLGHPVVGIGMRAFLYNTEIERVEIEGSIYIEEEAFRLAVNLTQINLEGITSIGNRAFSQCEKIEEIRLESARAIGDLAFSRMTSLKNVYIGNEGHVLSIGERALSYNTELHNLEIAQHFRLLSYPDILTGSNNIENLYLKSINYASESLELYSVNITIPELFGIYTQDTNQLNLSYLTIDYISVIPTSFCDSLKISSVTISNFEGEKIGDYAFNSCRNLTMFSINDVVKNIGRFAFYETGISSLSLTEVEVIGQSAFSRSKIRIFSGNNLISIGQEAFSECTALTIFVLNGNTTLTSIGYAAFANCEKLFEFFVPPTIDYIPSQAFKNCISLQRIVFRNLDYYMEADSMENCFATIEYIA